jgi:hypothetical protein
MNKKSLMFNELILLAETKKVKKGGGLAAVLKLIQDMTEFENSIQECMDAQDIADYRSQIEAFLADIDKMYETLFNMAKTGIQSMRNERGQILEEPEGQMDEKPAPAATPPEVKEEVASPRTFTIDELKKEMEKVSPPSSSQPIKVPQAPEKPV